MKKNEMKAALLFGIQDLRVVDVPIPTVRPNTVLVKVHACGLCPTDLRKYHTLYGGTLKLPTNLGHEYVGTAVEVGPSVENIEVGMRVMGDGFGGFAEYALLDLDLEPPVHVPQPVIIPESVSDNAATFVEPLGACIHAIKDQANLKKNQTVLIIGAGTMGQLLLMVAKEIGCRVLVSEPYAKRRQTALSFGADAVIDPQTESLIEAIRHFNEEKLVDTTILTIGNPESVQAALETVRPCGTLILFGRFPYGAKIAIDPSSLYRDEVRLVGSYWVGASSTCANVSVFRHALSLIETDRVPVEKLVSATYPLSQIHEAFAETTRMDTFKIVITLDE